MQQIFIHETAVVDNGCTIGEGTKIWHFSHIMSACTVGNYCTIGQNVFIASGVKVGNNVKIQNNVSLFEGIICEDEVFIGPSAVFTNVINPRSAVSRKHEYKPTILRKGVTIGANATIVCNIVTDGSSLHKLSLEMKPSRKLFTGSHIFYVIASSQIGLKPYVRNRSGKLHVQITPIYLYYHT